MRIGVDLGGTKIEAIALLSSGDELLRRRIPTPQGDYRGTIAAVASLVQEIEAELGVVDVDRPRQIGIGIPGAISQESGLVKNANSTCLIGEPLQQDLERALNRAVKISNDANCFAISEATDGAG
ncbi:MAG TPA: ROK family protein, partial [Ectothiorhodospiraceae bacterium]|nr:ROK family protein [Ectothiorhodospiraceae bacterium]